MTNTPPRNPDILRLPPKKQCSLLGIAYDEVEAEQTRVGARKQWVANFTGHPDLSGAQTELWAYFHLAEQGWAGDYSEGAVIFMLLRAATLDTLVEYPPWNFCQFGRKSTMWDRHLAAQGPLVGTTGANLDYAAELGIDLERERHRDRAIISAMGNSDEDVIRRGFRDIRAVHSEVAWYESYRFLTEEIFAGIWRALGADRLRLVAEALERKSFEYQRGWPDLTLARNGELLLVEVKTSDRLIGSQIRIHQELLEPLSIPFKVLRIKKIRSE